MSIFRSNFAQCQKLPRQVRTVNSDFFYDPNSTPSSLAVPFSALYGTDQLVISGDVTAPNTAVAMPTHTALLELFKRPERDSSFSIVVTNLTPFSVDLTATNPPRTATVPALTVARLYFRVVDPTPVVGTADVKLQVTGAIGGTGCLPPPFSTYDLTPFPGPDPLLVVPQALLSLEPRQLLFTTSPGFAGFAGLAGNGILYNNADPTSDVLVSVEPNQVFTFGATSLNQSGGAIQWDLAVAATGIVTTYAPLAGGGTGPTFLTQPAGSVWGFTFRVTPGAGANFAGTVTDVGVKELTP
jgi:hypothetical protein